MESKFSIQDILSREDNDSHSIMFDKDNPLVIPRDYINNNKNKQRNVDVIFSKELSKITNKRDKDKFIKVKEKERDELLAQLRTYAQDYIYECMLNCAQELCKLQDYDCKIVSSYCDIRKAIVNNLFETKCYEDVISTFECLFKITYYIFDRSKLWNQAISHKFMKMHNVSYINDDQDSTHDSLGCYVAYVKATLVRNMMQSIKKSTGFYLSISSSDKKERRKKSVFCASFIRCDSKKFTPEEYYAKKFQTLEQYTRSTKRVTPTKPVSIIC
jgi:hypothetical protein